VHIDIQVWLQHYGYFGVFVILLLEPIGIPFPAETTLTLAGIEWTRGVFALMPLLMAAALGNIVGSSVAYVIGRFLGRPVILRYGRYVGITKARLDTAGERFNRFQALVVLASKFVAGIRVLVPYVAGIERMPFALFSLYNAASALVWAGAFLILGRTLGVEWARYHVWLEHHLTMLIILLVVIVGAVVVYRVFRHRSDD
jgi:membrane protein DedA with SNARE-associated domain